MCPQGKRHSAAHLARKPRSWPSNPRSPAWPPHRVPCRAAECPPPRTGERRPCTRRGECPLSTQSARSRWRRTSSSLLLFDLCAPADLGWWSGCRADPGTAARWWARRSARWCPCRTGARQKCRSVKVKAGEFLNWPSNRLTSLQVSVLKASQRRESGHWKPKLFISGSQLDLTCSQSSLQGGLAFPDTHFGV